VNRGRATTFYCESRKREGTKFVRASVFSASFLLLLLLLDLVSLSFDCLLAYGGEMTSARELTQQRLNARRLTR